MKIETFSTGGGIWISEAVISDNGNYAVVSSECPEILSLYRKPESEEEKYLPEDMYLSKSWDELDTELSTIHGRLCLELQKKGAVGR